ncbi:hypothetical protein Acr_04g0001950 [Actinidia rufa]|uniref:Uncharacterized protein n=1 Tax=Actinidia rufa TaxID=165716 RepID=A0A7J0EIJ6_9ERIC|nr:hypothetical protein Acr_04g0001950 [Actinidia rufa]
MNLGVRALGKKKVTEVEVDHLVPDLVLALPSPAVEGKRVGSSTSPLRIGGSPKLWALKFAAVELGKQVTSADTSRDHEPCLAFKNAIMLPSPHVVDLILQQVVVNSERLNKSWSSSGRWLLGRCSKKFLIAASIELAILTRTHPIKPSDPPAVYSPLIGLGFNEEKYMNQPANKEGVTAEGVVAVEVGTTQGNELIGGEGEIADEGEGKKAGGAEGEGGDEQDPNTPPAA